AAGSQPAAALRRRAGPGGTWRCAPAPGPRRRRPPARRLPAGRPRTRKGRGAPGRRVPRCPRLARRGPSEFPLKDGLFDITNLRALSDRILSERRERMVTQSAVSSITPMRPRITHVQPPVDLQAAERAAVSFLTALGVALSTQATAD